MPNLKLLENNRSLVKSEKSQQHFQKSNLRSNFESGSPEEESENCTTDSGRIRLPNPTSQAHLEKKEAQISGRFCGSKPTII